jgi:hypothetical protein
MKMTAAQLLFLLSTPVPPPLQIEPTSPGLALDAHFPTLRKYLSQLTITVLPSMADNYNYPILEDYPLPFVITSASGVRKI